MPKKGKLEEQLQGLPPGSRVERMPTRIYEESVPSEYDNNSRIKQDAVESGDVATYDKADRRNRMLDAVESGDVALYDRIAEEGKERIQLPTTYVTPDKAGRGVPPRISQTELRGLLNPSTDMQALRRDRLEALEYARRNREKNKPKMQHAKSPPMYMQPDGTTSVHRPDEAGVREINRRAFNQAQASRTGRLSSNEPEQEATVMSSVLQFLRD